MNRTISAALLLFAACCGCCACDSSCDYLPPVLDGPYSGAGMRSGGATATEYGVPTAMESEPITPPPVVEVE